MATLPNIVNWQAERRPYNSPVQTILALETSCDETAVAILRGRELLASDVASQIAEHEKFGGVVPEVAARSHVQTINLMNDEALAKAELTADQLDGIACTRGPGLIGTLPPPPGASITNCGTP